MALHVKHKQNKKSWDREIGQQLGTLAVLPKDQGLTPSTHMAAQKVSVTPWVATIYLVHISIWQDIHTQN